MVRLVGILALCAGAAVASAPSKNSVVVSTGVASNHVMPSETITTHDSDGKLFTANVNDVVLDTKESVDCCHSDHVRLACCPVVGEGSPELQAVVQKYKLAKVASVAARKKMMDAQAYANKMEKAVISQREADEKAAAKKLEEAEKYKTGLDIKIPSTLRSYSVAAEDIASP